MSNSIVQDEKWLNEKISLYSEKFDDDMPEGLYELSAIRFAEDYAKHLQTEKLLNTSRVAALLMNGWDLEKRSLYDEEGVEGWLWTDENGNETTTIGDWSGWPVLTDDMEVIADRYRPNLSN